MTNADGIYYLYYYDEIDIKHKQYDIKTIVHCTGNIYWYPVPIMFLQI